MEDLGVFSHPFAAVAFIGFFMGFLGFLGLGIWDFFGVFFSLLPQSEREEVPKQTTTCPLFGERRGFELFRFPHGQNDAE